MKQIALISLALLIAAGCSQAATEFSDPNQPIEIKAGSEFNILLEANPTTGYHWEIIGELDPNVVEYVSNEYTADQPVLTGSGGKDHWKFKAMSTGETRITLGYYPPSNDPVEPYQTVTFTVTVK